jgi:hypothetical protein
MLFVSFQALPLEGRTKDRLTCPYGECSQFALRQRYVLQSHARQSSQGVVNDAVLVNPPRFGLPAHYAASFMSNVKFDAIWPALRLYGKVSAMTSSGMVAPPIEKATYCLPPAMYVIGAPPAFAGSGTSARRRPLALSYA